MATGYDYQKFAVLYVDDEEQALKYFPKAFEKDFRVFTAPNVHDALEIISSRADEIAIVITDQRMPGKTGVDLLGQLRQNRPNIIRILTTAYADIDSAIDGVNSGAIYKYVVKPWNIKELRGTLMRAMEFFLVQRERDMLFREKLSVLQRLIITDRVRSLAVLAAGLSHHIRNSMSALQNFFDLGFIAPNTTPNTTTDAALNTPAVWENAWSLAQRESQQILKIVQTVTDTVVPPHYCFADEIELHALVRASVDQAASHIAEGGSPGKFIVEMPPGLPRLKVDKTMIERLFTILVERTARLNRPGGTVVVAGKTIVPVWGTSGIQILISGEGAAWTDHDVAAVFTPFTPSKDNPKDLGLDLLSAFFIAYHHGGDLLVHKAPPAGPGFELLLPFSPDAAHRPDLEVDLMEKLFLRFEADDAPQLESPDGPAAANRSAPSAGGLRAYLRTLPRS